MRLVAMRVHSIAIADPPLRSSYGLHSPYALRTILELESDDHLVGIAETYGGEAPAAALEALRPRVVGADPYRLPGALTALLHGEGRGAERSQTYLVPGENPLDASTRTYAAIEVACLDLIGRSVGRPVCDLLGGRVRDEVPFAAYPFFKHAGGGGEGPDEREDVYGEVLSPEALLGEVRQMVADYGFRSIKLKGGILEPEVEIESVKLLRRSSGPRCPCASTPTAPGRWTPR